VGLRWARQHGWGRLGWAVMVVVVVAARWHWMHGWPSLERSTCCCNYGASSLPAGPAAGDQCRGISLQLKLQEWLVARLLAAACAYMNVLGGWALYDPAWQRW
jgi:hypothetical protein